jgi:hypothetical protein
MVLPDYQGDPLVLAARLVPDLRATTGGALYRPPIVLTQALPWLLENERDAITLDALAARLRQVFGEFAPELPDAPTLAPLFDDTPWVLDGTRVVRRLAAAVAPDPVRTRDPEAYLAVAPTTDPGQQVVDLLRAAARNGGWRLVVAAPEHEPAIGRSLTRALDATGIDLADAWFCRHAATLDRDARAATVDALRVSTRARLHTLFDELVATHGAPGRTVVVYRTGLLDLLGGVEQIRQLHERVSGRARGLWVLVIPGMVSDRTPRQPLFNGRTPTFHLQGQVLPLNAPVPT